MAKSNLTVDFKSTSFYALKLVLLSNDNETLMADLNKRIHDAGDFYAGEAIVIDITNLDQAPDWQAVIQILKDNNMYPIGIQTNPKLESACSDSGLAVLDIVSNGKIKSDTPKVTEKTKTDSGNNSDKPKSVKPADLAAKKTMVINRPLRSGQSIYAKDSDLVVIGMVSQGAEIIADGNIHVYGPLRGKAIAGASGDTNALILTTQLDPELLAIAGVYRVIETDLPNNLHDMPAKIELSGDTLKFQQLK